MRRLTWVRHCGDKVRRLNLSRGFFRLWVVAAVPIAVLSVTTSALEYRADASRYSAWESRPTVNEATYTCVNFVDALRDGVRSEGAHNSKFDAYFKQKGASAESEYAGLVALPQRELEEACQHRAEREDHVASIWHRREPASLVAAALQALTMFSLIAVAPVAAVLTLWTLSFFLARWIIRGFRQ